MGKVHPGLQAFADELVLRKFLAVVKRQRLAPRLVRAQQIDNLVAGGNNCINVQLCALCHAHQGVAPCTRLQLSRTQGHNRTTMRAAARLPPPQLQQ